MLDMVITQMQEQSPELAAEAFRRDPETDTVKLSDTQRSILKEKGDDTWVFASYRKSGCNLAENILRQTSTGCSWDNNSRSVLHQPWEAIDAGDPEVFKDSDFSNHFCNPDMDVLQALPRYRLVHLVRNPVEVVLSSYRYHREESTGWLSLPVRQARNTRHVLATLRRFRTIVNEIPASHTKVLVSFADAVLNGATLSNYYNNASEADGVIVEAYRSWPELDLVTKNLQRTRTDTRALQVRMESVQYNFKDTMKCMFKFLNESRWVHVDTCTDEVKSLMGKKSSDLHGLLRYNQTVLRQSLQTVQYMERLREAYHVKAAREC